MNPSANNPTANNSEHSPQSAHRAPSFPSAPGGPSQPQSAPKAGSSMGTLKILIPIVALIGVVFGITFFSQYTPPSDDSKPGKKVEGGESPLHFFTSTRRWDPPLFAKPTPYQPFDYRGLPLLAPTALDPDMPFRYSVQDRAFPAFFEVYDAEAGPKHPASFWFENPHRKPVSMQLKYVSCGACSGGNVAAIPPDVTKQILQMSHVSVLPQGLLSGLPLGMVGPAANLDEPRMSWQKFVFRDKPDATYKIPAAGENPDGWSPQWGILQLQFSVGKVGTKQLAAEFESVVEGTQLVERNKFVIVSEGVNPFDLSRSLIDLGEMSEKSEPRKFDIIAFSSTRGARRTGIGEMGDLAAPTAGVRMPHGGDPGEFIQIGPPQRIPDDQLDQVVAENADPSQPRKMVRVEAAYRYTVTFNPKAGGKNIDIGLFERDIWFTLPNAEERLIHVRGMVSGIVWLANNQNEIEMGVIPRSTGLAKNFTLLTARNDLKVKLLDQSKPGYLVVKLDKDPKPPSADRGYYKLTVRVPSAKESTQVRAGSWSGEIVLEVVGSTAQRIRIPIKGRIELN